MLKLSYGEMSKTIPMKLSGRQEHFILWDQAWGGECTEVEGLDGVKGVKGVEGVEAVEGLEGERKGKEIKSRLYEQEH